MLSCLRIFGAYLYRLTRKHSTVLLIAFFILCITVILQLYASKHQENPHFRPRFGDFEYKPGAFLKGQLPNENASYCQFNYGLPDVLLWDTIRVHVTPEMGVKSPYRVIYNAIKSSAYTNNSRDNAVTYVTQATPEFVYHIIEIARYWSGPISLSVFVPDYDLDITIQIMNQLCQCYTKMSKVSLHLFYPKQHPPKLRAKEQFISTTTEMPTTTTNVTTEELMKIKLENYRNLDNKTRAEYIQKARQNKIKRMMMRMNRPNMSILSFQDCSGYEYFDVTTFRREHNMVYPINVGRNVARNASKTSYFLVSDIEMVPSEGLAPKFLAMIRKIMGDKKRDEGCVFLKTVFVVPLFEVERGEGIPRTKTELVEMVSENRASYFHQKVCAHCQRFPGLQTWLLTPPMDFLKPMMIARREYPYHRWEPLYFGTQKEPWYSEQLSWEGRQDKMVQMLELCLQEYRMVVLDGGFLCHAAVSKPGSRHTRAEKINTQRYIKMTADLKTKYPNRPQCKVEWRC